MPSESRRPYVALTPSHADFALQSPGETSEPVAASWPEPQEPQPRWRAALDSARQILSLNAGLLLVIAAQGVFSLINVAVKTLQSLEEPVSTLELIIVRMAATYIFSVAYMFIRSIPDPFIGPKGVRLLLVFRGLTGFIGLNGAYFPLQYLSLSDSTVLAFLVPLCTAMAGSVFLKETFTRKEALAGLCSLFGVVLIARPAFLFGSSKDSTEVDEQHRMLAVGVALLGVLGSTGAMTTIRAIGTRAHPMHLLAMFSLQSVIGASIIMIILRQPFFFPTRPAWLGLLAVIGVLGFPAQILLTMGFQREAAGRASMGLYTQIIFATILERIFFHTTPSFLSFLGTSIIVSSAVYVAATKKSEKETRKHVANEARSDLGPRPAQTYDGDEGIPLEEGLLPLSASTSKVVAGTSGADALATSSLSHESEDSDSDSDIWMDSERDIHAPLLPVDGRNR